MGRIVVVSFVSVDGVVQSPLSPDEDRDGGFALGGWVVPHSDDVVDGFVGRATVGAAGLLLGRRSYDILFEARADADDPDPAVAAMNAMPQHVVSSSPELPWQNSHQVRGALAPAVEDLRRSVDGELVVLGGGKRLFGQRGAPARFALTDTVVSPSGVVILTWARRRQA